MPWPVRLGYCERNPAFLYLMVLIQIQDTRLAGYEAAAGAERLVSVALPLADVHDFKAERDRLCDGSVGHYAEQGSQRQLRLESPSGRVDIYSGDLRLAVLRSLYDPGGGDSRAADMLGVVLVDVLLRTRTVVLRSSEACTTQLAVEVLMFSVLLSSTQLLVIAEPLMVSLVFSLMVSLVCLAALLAAPWQATRHLVRLARLQAFRLTCRLLEAQMLAAVLTIQLEATPRLVRLRAALALHAILVVVLARHRVCSVSAFLLALPWRPGARRVEKRTGGRAFKTSRSRQNCHGALLRPSPGAAV